MMDGTEAEVELREALNSGAIVPFFQPLVQVRSGALFGFEVLARWRHPVRGMGAHDYFIPLAERAGLIGLPTETNLQELHICRYHDRSIRQRMTEDRTDILLVPDYDRSSPVEPSSARKAPAYCRSVGPRPHRGGSSLRSLFVEQ